MGPANDPLGFSPAADESTRRAEAHAGESPVRHRGFTQFRNDVLLGEVHLPDGRPLSTPAIRLYGVLYHYASRSMGVCTAAQKTIAAHMGLSTRRVRTLLDQLQAAGLIRVRREGRGVTNTILVVGPREEKPSSAHPRTPASHKRDNGSDTNNLTEEPTSLRDNQREGDV